MSSEPIVDFNGLLDAVAPFSPRANDAFEVTYLVETGEVIGVRRRFHGAEGIEKQP